jgi:hypothetical protein
MLQKCIPFLLFLALIACNKAEKPIEEKPPINYEILRSWTIPTSHTPGGGYGMELLVSDSTTQDQAINLARYFHKKRKRDEFLIIQIFDSREAYDNRDNENYPEEKYFKHFLVDMTVNPNTDYDRVSWVAKGRDH